MSKIIETLLVRPSEDIVSVAAKVRGGSGRWVDCGTRSPRVNFDFVSLAASVARELLGKLHVGSPQARRSISRPPRDPRLGGPAAFRLVPRDDGTANRSAAPASRAWRIASQLPLRRRASAVQMDGVDVDERRRRIDTRLPAVPGRVGIGKRFAVHADKASIRSSAGRRRRSGPYRRRPRSRSYRRFRPRRPASARPARQNQTAPEAAAMRSDFMAHAPRILPARSCPWRGRSPAAHGRASDWPH